MGWTFPVPEANRDSSTTRQAPSVVSSPIAPCSARAADEVPMVASPQVLTTGRAADARWARRSGNTRDIPGWDYGTAVLDLGKPRGRARARVEADRTPAGPS